MADALGSIFAASASSTPLPVVWVSGPAATYPSRSAGIGGTVPNPNHDVGLTGNAALPSQFFWDFYNRVYVTPKHIDFGSLSGPVTRTIDIWNARLTSATLTHVTEVGTEGIELSDTDPRVFRPLELLQYTTRALLDGPPTIEASYQFEFGTGDVPVVTMSGSRAKVWPFPVDWSDSYKVSYSYKTDIWTSRSNREQRRALRTTPRKTVAFTSQANHGKLQIFRRLMATWQNKVMVMPEFTRSAALAAPIVGGATVASLTAMPDWMVADMTVVLIDGESIEIRKVQSVSGNSVTFTAGGGGFSTSAKIHPGLEGILSENIPVRQLTNAVATVAVTFNVTPCSEPDPIIGSAEQTLIGREVWMRRPNWKESVDFTYQFGNEYVDYGRGRIATFRPIAFGLQLIRATYANRRTTGGFGPDQALVLERFFARMKGRRGEFYFPTGLNDLDLAANILAGNFYIRVPGQDVYAAYVDDTVHRALEIVMRDGRRVHRKIDEILTVSDSDGDDTLLHVTEAIPFTMNIADVLRVSWMPVFRHASDDMTIEWLSTKVAQVQFTFQGLEDLTPE